MPPTRDSHPATHLEGVPPRYRSSSAPLEIGFVRQRMAINITINNIASNIASYKCPEYQTAEDFDEAATPWRQSKCFVTLGACLEAAKSQRPAMLSMWRVSVVVDSRHLDEPQSHAPK